MLFAVLTVGYYMVNPVAVVIGAPSIAPRALTFPILVLVPALFALVFSAVAYRSVARIAGTGFALAGLLAGLLVAWPTFEMWQMAEREHVAVSLVSNFTIRPHPYNDPARETRDVVYGRTADGTDLLLDFWPANRQAVGLPRPAVIRIHGGGWVSGAKGNLAGWNGWLNELGYDVFDVNYRTSPPERWLHEVGDVKCAIGWVFANARHYGIDPTRISLMGYSAGGNLALLAAYGMNSRDLPPSCEAMPVPIKAVINIYGPADPAALYDTSGSPGYIRDVLEKYLGGPPGEFPDRYKRYSPLTYVSVASPPTISFLGLMDRLIPREQFLELDRALAARGVFHEIYLLPGADHSFDSNWENLATQFTRAKIKSFLQTHG